MQLKAIRTDLLHALGRVQKVAPEKTTMAILSHAVLRADGKANRLLVEGTDLVTGASGVIVADVAETGGVAVPATAFLKILKNANSEVVELREKDGHCHIKAGRSRWKLPAMPASDHPGMPEPPEELPAVGIDGGVIRKGFLLGSYAPSKKEGGNEAIKGVLFEVASGNLFVVSTNGRRLAAAKMNVSGVPDFSHIVSQSSVEILLHFLDEAKGPVSVKQWSSYLSFSRVLSPSEGQGDGLEVGVVTKTIQAKFPPYQRVIPAKENIKFKFLVNRNSFAQSVRRVMAAAKEKGAAIALELHTDRLSIVYENVRWGAGRDEMDMDLLLCPPEFQNSEKPFRIEANYEYLLEALGVLDHDEVLLSCCGPKEAISIYGMAGAERDRESLHLVMPIFLP